MTVSMGLFGLLLLKGSHLLKRLLFRVGTIKLILLFLGLCLGLLLLVRPLNDVDVRIDVVVYGELIDLTVLICLPQLSVFE